MGVQGLWSLLDQYSFPLDYSALNGKCLAIDASIWIYQLSKSPSYRTTKSNSIMVAGIFRRLAKLHHFGIRPVFVFDGLPPLIKREELKRRAEQREKNISDVRKIAYKILKTRLRLLVSGAASETKKARIVTDEADDLFKLAPLGIDAVSDDDHDDLETNEDEDSADDLLLQVNVESAEFLRLPVDIQQDILLQLKERLYLTQDPDILQRDPNSFTLSQLESIRKRYRITSALDRLKGINCDHPAAHKILPKRIASSEKKAFVLVKNDSHGYTFQPRANKGHIQEESKERPPKSNQDSEDESFMKEFFGESNVPQMTLRSPDDVKFPEQFDSIETESKQLDVLEEDIGPKNPVVAFEPNGTLGVAKGPVVMSKGQSGLIYQEASPAGKNDIKPIGNNREDNGDILRDTVNEHLVTRSDEMPIAEKKEMIRRLQEELVTLEEEQMKKITFAEEITSEAGLLFKELLDAFGFPWVVATGEAEAQCAQMFIDGCVDGIVTDDSDTFLFGGNMVYRHFFKSKDAYPTGYNLESLSRDDLIFMGLLIGGDYGPGIPGIGPKKALAILEGLKSDSLEDRVRICKDKDDARVATFFKDTDQQAIEAAINKRIIDAYRNPSIEVISSNCLSWGTFQKNAIVRILLKWTSWTETDIQLNIEDLMKTRKSCK